MGQACSLEYQRIKRSKKAPFRTFDGKKLWAKVMDVYDGDTITVQTRLSKNERIFRYKVRINGIDTPEIRGGTGLETQAAIRARDELKRLICHKMVRLHCHKEEKYGRLLADVYVGSHSVADIMVKKGLAVWYNGGTKLVWTTHMLNRMAKLQFRQAHPLKKQFPVRENIDSATFLR